MIMLWLSACESGEAETRSVVDGTSDTDSNAVVDENWRLVGDCQTRHRSGWEDFMSAGDALEDLERNLFVIGYPESNALLLDHNGSLPVWFE